MVWARLVLQELLPVLRAPLCVLRAAGPSASSFELLQENSLTLIALEYFLIYLSALCENICLT